uniref:Uncharacterized protein n=1 Tax=CrAss-like virus sp. ctYsL76 TaxID=2826826 RepID=A0A8S5QL97_9CAUD|nr:MAG TPA: hypothetical protein [CrAss-like virus sp. ctYsL76]
MISIEKFFNCWKVLRRNNQQRSSESVQAFL